MRFPKELNSKISRDQEHGSRMNHRSDDETQPRFNWSRQLLEGKFAPQIFEELNGMTTITALKSAWKLFKEAHDEQGTFYQAWDAGKFFLVQGKPATDSDNARGNPEADPEQSPTRPVWEISSNVKAMESEPEDERFYIVDSGASRHMIGPGEPCLTRM